jgi:hypothetical protein
MVHSTAICSDDHGSIDTDLLLVSAGVLPRDEAQEVVNLASLQCVCTLAARNLGYCAAGLVNPFSETASLLLHHSFELGVAERNFERLPVFLDMAPKRSCEFTPTVRPTKGGWVRLRDVKFAPETGAVALATFALMMGIVWMDSAASGAADRQGVAYDQAGRSGYSHANRTVLSKLVEGISGWGQCQIIIPCAQEVDKDTDGVPLYWDDPTDPRSVAAVK